MDTHHLSWKYCDYYLWRGYTKLCTALVGTIDCMPISTKRIAKPLKSDVNFIGLGIQSTYLTGLPSIYYTGHVHNRTNFGESQWDISFDGKETATK